MSPMLLALVIGWAVVTVIVIAVSIVAIRSQRHGAEDEEVLIPWAQQQSVPSNQVVPTHPLDMDAEQLSAAANTGLQPVIKPSKQPSQQTEVASRPEVASPDVSMAAAATALKFKAEAPSVNTQLNTQTNSEGDLSKGDSGLKASEPINQSDQPLKQKHTEAAQTAADLFISAETRFIRTLKQAIAPEMNVWRSLTHNDLNDSDNVVSIAQDGMEKTGLEHEPILYSLHLNDSFKPLCLIHFEKKKSLSGKISGRKAIQRVRKLAAVKKLPLIRIDESNQYAVSELQDLLAYHLPDRLLAERQQPKQHQPHVAQDKIEHRHDNPEKVCPRCASGMSKKIATRGKYEGTRFWACDTYPKCRQVEIIHREYAKAQSS